MPWDRQKAIPVTSIRREETGLPGVVDNGMSYNWNVRELGRPCRLLKRYDRQVISKRVKRAPKSRESDYGIVLMKQGNACGGKAVTYQNP